MKKLGDVATRKKYHQRQFKIFLQFLERTTYGGKDAVYRSVRWYKSRQDFLDPMQTKQKKALTITSTSTPGVSVKRCNVKALSGRGRKGADWVEYLHGALREEFERHSSAGFQMSRGLLQHIAVSLIHKDESPFDAEKN